MNHTELYIPVKRALSGALKDRLVQVVHYGSSARGDAQPESDVDFLVVLRGPVKLGGDLDTIVHALYPIQLETEIPIHAVPVDEIDYVAGEFGLYRSAHRDGVAL